MSERQQQERECLRCDRRFLSQGPGHRICKRCTQALAGEPSPEQVYPFNLWTAR